MSEQLEGRARELIAAPNFATISTLRKDGTVHSAVVWADVEDGRIALNSSEGRAWPANVRRDPRITLTVPNQENPYEYVYIRGTVVEDTTDGADEHIDKLAKKYMDVDEYPFRQEGEQRLIIKVSPDKIMHNNPG